MNRIDRMNAIRKYIREEAQKGRFDYKRGRALELVVSPEDYETIQDCETRITRGGVWFLFGQRIQLLVHHKAEEPFFL